jgi:hypothetical protein
LWVDQESEPKELLGRAVSLSPGVVVEGMSLHSSSMVLLWVDRESRNKERVTSTKYSRIRVTKGVPVANLVSPPKELYEDKGLPLSSKALFGMELSNC